MAKDGPGGEKTEKPTPQRIKKGRKEGQIPRTAELGTWLAAAAASILLPMLVGSSFDTARGFFLQIGRIAESPEPAAINALFAEALMQFMTTILPTAVALLVVGVAASAAQGGVTFATKAMKPSWKKLNPFSGIKRMFGTHGLWEAVKALLKVIALTITIILTSDRAQQLVSASGALPLSVIAEVFTDAAILMIRVTAITGLVLAVADYVVTRMKMMKDMKMSLYEIKQEFKQSEGDPHIKAQRRARAMSISRNRMISDVASADVLLVNPTHVAVALKYDPARGAPRVIAKGADLLAARLREKATEHRIPLVHDIPLARALHRSCEVGQEVPAQLFTAVARVLAFVMHLKTRGVVAGEHKPGFPAPVTEGLPVAGRRR